MFRFILLLLILLFLSPFAIAISPQEEQLFHTDNQARTGIIEGTLFIQDEGGKKTFLSNSRVILVVFYQGERILMLDKTTDAKGFFKFGNIFQDPNYAYALVSMLDNSLYVIPDLGLARGEDKKVVEFWIGAGSSYFMANISDMEDSLESPMQQGSMGLAESQKAQYSVSTRWAKTYQQMAMVLSAIVLVLVILFSFSKTKN